MNIVDALSQVRSGLQSKRLALWKELHPDLPVSVGALSSRVSRLKKRWKGALESAVGTPVTDDIDEAESVSKPDSENTDAALDSTRTFVYNDERVEEVDINSHTATTADVDNPETMTEISTLNANEHVDQIQRVQSEVEIAPDRREVDGSLMEEFSSVYNMLSERTEEGSLENRKRIFCKGLNPTCQLMTDMNNIIKEAWQTGENSFWRLNCLVYAAAVVVNRRWRKIPLHGRKKPVTEDPRVEKRKAQILNLRRRVGWLSCEVQRRKQGKRPTPKQKRLVVRLRKIFGVKSLPELKTLLESQKGILRVKSLQLRRIKTKERERMARMKFERQGIRSLEGRPHSEPSNQPEQSDLQEYWTGILGQDGLYDLQDSAISGWLKSLRVSETGDLRERVTEEVGRKVLRKVLRKAHPWKAPGPDGITTFWWKGFPTAAQGLFKLTR